MGVRHPPPGGGSNPREGAGGGRLRLEAFVAKQLLQNSYGVFLSYLVKEASKHFNGLSRTALYHRIRRILLSWEKKGLIQLSKVDGMVFARPLQVDLISIISKFQTNGKLQRRFCKTANLPRKLHPLRREAARFLTEAKELDRQSWEYLFGLFADYLSDVNSRIIVLKHTDVDEYLLLRYNHRFRKHRLREIRRRYREVWDTLSAKCHVGVFLTLTADPKRYNSLYEISREIPKAFNRFKSWVRRKRKLRRSLPYICVYEFQDKGMLHLHVVFFGIGRIADKKTELTPALVKMGFGEVNYIYKIVRKGGRWTWAKKKPRGARLSPEDYLEKYLVKAFNLPDLDSSDVKELSIDEMKVSMYWATGKRFFTYSRISSIGVGVGSAVLSRVYVFVGVFYLWDIPDEVLDFAFNPEVFYYLATGPPLPS